MKTLLLAFALLYQSSFIFAGNCPRECRAVVNALSIYSYPAIVLSNAWAGNCYIGSVSGDFIHSDIYVYFKPGDTIYLDSKTVTDTGWYMITHYYCSDNQWWDNIFHVAFLPDTLETYYKYHFDHHFLDSLAAVQKAMDDSLAAVKRGFDDSVTAVPAIFYPNPVADIITFECFKTVQAPFDFQAYDLQGRCILSRRIEFTESYQTQTVDMSFVDAGTYVVKYLLNGNTYTRQVIKL